MARVFFCTQGTSLANPCGDLLREQQKVSHPWEYDPPRGDPFIKEFKAHIDGLQKKSVQEVGTACAELDSLYRAKLTADDTVVLLATDTYLGKVCTDALKRLLENVFKLSPDKISIERIVDLQVHDPKRLEETGYKNFLELVRKKVETYQQSGCELYFCPNGGYKGVVLFLTIFGMLYHIKIIYTFEHAKKLVTLPSLPFTLDRELFKRAENALRCLSEEIEQPEAVYLKNIQDYTEEERALFMGFVQSDGKGKVTPLSLLEPYICAAERPFMVMMTKEAVNTMEELRKADNKSYSELLSYIKNAQNPEWRNRSVHYHPLERIDLVAIKPGPVSARLLGYPKNNQFYVTHVFKKHDAYDRVINGRPAPKAKDYPDSAFISWSPEELGTKRNATLFEELTKENDRLTERNEIALAENKKLSDEKRQLQTAHQQQLSGAQRQIERLQTEAKTLKDKISTLEQETIPLYLKSVSLWQLFAAWWRFRKTP